MNNDTIVNVWHYRTVDLTPFAGKTANKLWVESSTATLAGSWNIRYGEIAIYSADGTVTTIYDRGPSEGFTYWTGGGETNTAAVVERSNTDTDAKTPATTTTYYVGDQIGSTRMQIAGGGWPVSMDNYYPFGVEQAIPADANHYKFTGKERDTESGNDYFGARYYGSIMGRFMSSDDGSDQDPSDPQSWNLYSYVRNNPLRNTDPTGNACVVNDLGSTYDDDSGGETCAEVAISPLVVSQTVTAQAGNAIGSFLINSVDALTNMAGDYFAAFTGLRAYQNDPLANDYTGKTANYAAQAALFMVGPEGEAGEVGNVIEVSEARLTKVLQTHTEGGLLSGGKSLFNAGEDVKGLIQAAASEPAIPQANGRIARIVDAGRIIGADRATGGSTSIYTVITDQSGNLVTAFPGRP